MEVERPEDDVSKAFYLPPSDFFFFISGKENLLLLQVESRRDGMGRDRTGESSRVG